MAIFGRKSARQRLRHAAEQSLSYPAYSPPVDCTPWVLGGLWPLELATVTPETVSLAEYLKRDLQKIANSANEKLKVISQNRMLEAARKSEETRVINVARAFAVLRVESTVRTLRREALGFSAEYLSLNSAERPEEAQRIVSDIRQEHPPPRHTAEPRQPDPRMYERRIPEQPRHRRPPITMDAVIIEGEVASPESTVAVPEEPVEPVIVEPDPPRPSAPAQSD